MEHLIELKDVYKIYQMGTETVHALDGIFIPAHIDKSSTSLLSNLGFVPLGSQFPCFELRCLEHLHRVRQENPYLTHCTVICDSDAHYLEHIHEPEHTLLCAERTPEAVLAALAGAP